MVAIHLSGVHVRIPAEVKRHAEEKLGALTRFHPGLSSLHVTMRPARLSTFRVDVEFHLPAHHEVVAHEESPSLMSAIDAVAAKCAAQLRRLHDRRRSPSGIRAAAQAVA